MQNLKQLSLLSLASLPFAIKKEHLPFFKTETNHKECDKYNWADFHPEGKEILEFNSKQLGKTCMGTAIALCMMARVAGRNERKLSSANPNILVMSCIMMELDKKTNVINRSLQEKDPKLVERKKELQERLQKEKRKMAKEDVRQLCNFRNNINICDFV
jgi:hypothetical protein